MRILLFTHKPSYPDTDGGTRAMRSMLEGLLNEGHEVWILTFSTHKHPYQAEAWPAPILEHTVVTPLPVDTEITSWDVFKNLFSRKSYILSRFQDRKLEPIIADVLEEWKPDVVQMDGLQPMLFARFVTGLRNVPILYRAHNVEHLIWQNLAAESGFLRKRYLKTQAKRLEREERKAVQSADGLIPISEADAEILKQWSSEKPMLTLPYGFDEDWFEGSIPLLPSGQFFHLGAMDWPPNQEAVKWLTEDIWPSFYQQEPKATLHLAGRDLSTEWQGEGIQNHGMAKDSAEFMQSHGVLLVPLKSGSGQRIKILEAMALGVPVVTTSVGLEGISLKDERLVLIADTNDEWIRQMKWCLENPEALNSMRQKARDWVKEHFGQETLMKQWTQFVEGEVLP